MSNVTDFPSEAPDLAETLFGPATNACHLVVEGRAIPKITVLHDGPDIEFILDSRYSYSFPREVAWMVAHFAANAMAVGAGYPSFAAEEKFKPFAPKCNPVGGIEE